MLRQPRCFLKHCHDNISKVWGNLCFFSWNYLPQWQQLRKLQLAPPILLKAKHRPFARPFLPLKLRELLSLCQSDPAEAV